MQAYPLTLDDSEDVSKLSPWLRVVEGDRQLVYKDDCPPSPMKKSRSLDLGRLSRQYANHGCLNVQHPSSEFTHEAVVGHYSGRW